MQIDELLQEYTASRTQFGQILNDASIRMGFECEMVAPYEFADNYDSYHDEDDYDDDESPDFDAMLWNDVLHTEGVSVNASRLHRIDVLHAEWQHERERAGWDRARDSFLPRYLTAHPGHDATDAYHAWSAAQERRLPHPGVGAGTGRLDNEPHGDTEPTVAREIEDHPDGMDAFIRAKYGSMSHFMDEFHIEWEAPRRERDDYDRDHNEAGVHSQMVDSLEQALGVTATTSDYAGRDDLSRWRVVEDGSISGDGTGAEVVSGVYPLKRGLEMLAATFRWMSDNDMETNKSTGLHVSFSIADKTDDDEYDFLKMMILFDENYTASLFARLKQGYAKQMRDVLFRDMQNNDPTSLMSSRHVGAVIAALKTMGKSLPSQLGFEKYYSFRHRADGVVEFRNMGGSGYEDKFEVIRTRIINMAYMMKVGSDETLLQREYLTRVYRMLTGTKFSNPALTKPAASPMKIPLALSAFTTWLQRRPQLAAALSDHRATDVVADELVQVAVGEMTTLQKRQLRFYLKLLKYLPKRARNFIGDDAQYNQLASLMGWPIVIPGDHDPAQEPLPFALRGRDMSGTPAATAAQPERSDRRQPNLPTGWTPYRA